MAAAMSVRILGPVQVLTADGSIDLPSASQRRLLGALAIHGPQPVRAEWLCWVLGVTTGALRTTVARLRRTVGPELVQTTATGYRLDVPTDASIACADLDAADGDPDLLRAALGRWVGPALDEFRDEGWAHGEANRLDEVRARAVEDLADALVSGGGSEEAITLLEPHIVEHEFRDRSRGLLMRALAASGRQTEALRAFQTYRSLLVERAGTEPSDEVRRIEQRILSGWNGIDVDEADDARPRSRDRAIGVVPAPLAATKAIVGRRRELAALVDNAASAERHGPRVVLVAGEAGIGKTSLLTALAATRGAGSGWSVFYDRCTEFAGEPFQPFRGLLSQIVDVLPTDAIDAHAARCGGDLARLVPGLRSRVPDAAPDPAEDPGTARHLLFLAAADLVARAAERGPVALLVDDLHWAESSGLELLRQLVVELAGVPVLVVGAFRDTGEATGDHLRAAAADLVREGATRVDLAGFDRDELGALVHARVDGSADHDVDEVVEGLLADTAGNPLFAEHLLQYWSESDQLGVYDGAVTRVEAGEDRLPATLRDLVWRRVGVLGSEAREVLAAAAVLGVEFDESVLAEIVDVDADELADLLDRASAAGVIAPAVPGVATARFTHALVARSSEAELGDRSRARLHAAALDAFQAPGRPGASAARLAHHAECAGRQADALRWATAAGDEAVAGLAAEEAVGWYRRALDHARMLDRPESVLAELMVRLGDAECRAGHPAGVDTLHDAAAVAERSGNDDALVRAALAINPGSFIRFGEAAPKQLAIAEAARARSAGADLATQARLEALVAQSLVHTDETERRTAAASSALELARASRDPAVLARVAPHVVNALWTPGTAAFRAAVAAEATDVAETLDDPSLAASVHYVAHTAAVCAGEAAAAAQHRRRLRAIADDLEEPRVRWIAAIVDAFTATMTCRFREADEWAGAAFAVGDRIGEPEAWTIFVAQSFVLGTFQGQHAELLSLVQPLVDAQESVDVSFRVAHAICCVEVGNLDAPRALLHDAIERGIDTIPHDLIRSTSLLGYAIIALDLEDVDAAAALLPEIEPYAHEVSCNGVTSQGPISAYAGKLLTLLGRHDEAERRLLDALATADSFGWEYHRASTMVALAQNRAVAAGGLDDDASRWLTTAEALCDLHGLGSWARRASALRARFART